MSKVKIGNIILFLTTGVMIIALWIILIVQGTIPQLSKNIVSFSFHWFTELFLAISLLATAAGLLKDKSWAYKYYFFVSGLLYSSVFNAIFYYISFLKQFSIVPVLSIILILSLLLLILIFNRITFIDEASSQLNSVSKKLILITGGMFIYIQINLCGKIIEENFIELGSVVFISIALIILFSYVAVKELKKVFAVLKS